MGRGRVGNKRKKMERDGLKVKEGDGNTGRGEGKLALYKLIFCTVPVPGVSQAGRRRYIERWYLCSSS